MKNFNPYKGATGRKKPIPAPSSPLSPDQKDQNAINYREQTPSSSSSKQDLKTGLPAEYSAKPTLKELGKRYENYLDYHNRMSKSVDDNESDVGDEGE